MLYINITASKTKTTREPTRVAFLRAKKIKN